MNDISNKKLVKIDKIFNIYLIIALVLLSILIIYINKHVLYSEYLMIATLIQCYFIFHNKGKIIGSFSIHNHLLYGWVNLSNKLYTSTFYSLYGAFLGLILLVRGKNEQNKLNMHKTIINLIIIIFIGLCVFFAFNYNKLFSIILLFDLIIFIGNVCAGFLAVNQSKWQFFVFIPIGIVQIIAGVILNEPVIIVNSIVYLFSDILTIFKWQLEYTKQFGSN